MCFDTVLQSQHFPPYLCQVPVNPPCNPSRIPQKHPLRKNSLGSRDPVSNWIMCPVCTGKQGFFMRKRKRDNYMTWMEEGKEKRNLCLALPGWAVLFILYLTHLLVLSMQLSLICITLPSQSPHCFYDPDISWLNEQMLVKQLLFLVQFKRSFCPFQKLIS